MSNRVEPEIPNITLDADLVKPAGSKPAPSAHSSASPQQQTVSKSSGTIVFFTVTIYLALAGAGYFFFLENQKLKNIVDDSQNRIQLLEDQLSATGEEMGESTVALKAKLQAITEKTEKLWAEMDKLWASAWRRNQTEIKELKSLTKKQSTANNNTNKSIDTIAGSLKDLREKQTASEFSVEALSDQVQLASTLKSDLNKVKSSLESLQQKIQGRDTQQVKVASNVNSLDMQIKMLLERIESLENKKPASVTQSSQGQPSAND